MTPTKRLLLVEDEALVRHDLKDALVEVGFDVSDVAEGGRALSELEADPSRFSGLITDVSLRRGPDGWTIAHRARELIPNLPVVYISGHGSADWPSKGVPNSLTLGKPFATAQLITAISTLLVEADAHKARKTWEFACAASAATPPYRHAAIVVSGRLRSFSLQIEIRSTSSRLTSSARRS